LTIKTFLIVSISVHASIAMSVKIILLAPSLKL